MILLFVFETGMRVTGGSDDNGKEFTLVMNIQEDGTDQKSSLTNRQGNGKMSKGKSGIGKKDYDSSIAIGLEQIRCGKSLFTPNFLPKILYV